MKSQQTRQADTILWAVLVHRKAIQSDMREKEIYHNCRDSFMLQLADTTADIKRRDLAPNINSFMNVPITKEGGYKFDDGVSARASMLR